MVSFDKLNSSNDESDNDGSDSRFAGMCAFTFCFNESVGHVGEYVGRFSVIESVIFVLTVIESIGNVVPLVVFVPKGVESKSGQLIETFCRPKY